MSRTVFLHVGLPKSGTSYIQKALSANRAPLREAGLLFPGKGWAQQVRAVQDLRGMRVGPSARRRVRGAWDRLVEEIAAWPGDAIVSMEWLAAAKPEQIRTIVDDLQPAHVEIVFTVRDVARTVPAAWQEFMQNRDVWTWEEFLQGVVAEDRTATPAGQSFWAQQDLAAILQRWTDIVPAEDVHVITVPHPGGGQRVLWHRLCEVVGDDFRNFSLDNLKRNPSLGLESAELMRRLNRVAREEGLPKPVYLQVFKHGMAKDVLAQRAGGESRLLLPVDYHDWAREEAARQIESLRASGVHTVGDLEDLRPVLDVSPGRQPADVPADELLDIALAALVAMADGWAAGSRDKAELRTENTQLKQRLDELEKQPLRSTARRYAHTVRRRLGRTRHAR